MGPRILIIEDEEKLARFVELELGYEGYDVVRPWTAELGLSWPRRAGLTSYCWT
jgi:DNA-binding response OmpR family regulator